MSIRQLRSPAFNELPPPLDLPLRTLKLTRFEMVHVALRSKVSFGELLTLMAAMSGSRAPLPSTTSRSWVVSPAMLPSPQMTCSRTSASGEDKRRVKTGTMPDPTTVAVCCEFPDATFVNAHATSN